MLRTFKQQSGSSHSRSGARHATSVSIFISLASCYIRIKVVELYQLKMRWMKSWGPVRAKARPKSDSKKHLRWCYFSAFLFIWNNPHLHAQALSVNDVGHVPITSEESFYPGLLKVSDTQRQYTKRSLLWQWLPTDGYFHLMAPRQGRVLQCGRFHSVAVWCWPCCILSPTMAQGTSFEYF